MSTERAAAATMQDSGNYYDVLDLKPDASPQEIREAYLRSKSAYNRDSVALYTLVSPEETEDMLKKIEEAYLVLSNPERRREYDRHHGLLTSEDLAIEEMQSHAQAQARKIISIDRVPPMDASEPEDDLLNPPKTDFVAKVTPIGPPPAPRSFAPSPASGQAPGPAQVQPVLPQGHGASPALPSDSTLNQEIAQEVEWKGAFLKRIRDARKISIEDLAETTKITKTYLSAIEQENFAKLPAAVFVRGFITQICRVLRLPADKVVTAYLARYYQVRPDKAR